MNKQQASLQITYTNKNKPIDLITIGKSLVGLDKALKKIYSLTNIEAELEIKTQNISQGSVIIDLILEITQNIKYQDLNEIINFLKTLNLSPDIYKLLYIPPNELYEQSNEIVKEHPLGFGIFGYFVQQVLEQVPSIKQKIYPRNVSKNFADKVHNLVNKKAFSQLVYPIIEEEIAEIKVSSGIDSTSVKINSSNFEAYLGDEDKILTQYENGKIYEMSGVLSSLQTNRGSTMTFKCDHILEKKHQLLTALPDDDIEIDFYLAFLLKPVTIRAEIIRESIYKKPKIKIKSIYINQDSFDFIESNQ